jgi:peptide/nickel transport system permease protein
VALYLLRRVLVAIPTLLLVVAIVFFGIRILPTDIADVIVEAAPFGGSALTKEAIRQQFDLDKPLLVQFGLYVSRLATGDLGVSAYDRRPVGDRIKRALPTTLELAAIAILISVGLAIAAGTVSAVYRDTTVDYTVRVVSITMFSIPVFWVGTMVIVFPAIWWRYFPPITYMSFFDDPVQNLRQFLPPAVVLGLALMGSVTRLVRSALLEVLRQDYVRTARAKGLRDRTVVIRHALRNGFLPVLSFIGLQVATLLGGTVIIESIFAMPGLGTLLLNSVLTRDYPVIEGTVLLFGAMVVLTNLLTDLGYMFVDPRVRHA